MANNKRWKYLQPAIDSGIEEKIADNVASQAAQQYMPTQNPYDPFVAQFSISGRSKIDSNITDNTIGSTKAAEARRNATNAYITTRSRLLAPKTNPVAYGKVWGNISPYAYAETWGIENLDPSKTTIVDVPYKLTNPEPFVYNSSDPFKNFINQKKFIPESTAAEGSKIDSSVLYTYTDSSGNVRAKLRVPKTSNYALQLSDTANVPSITGNDLQTDVSNVFNYMDVDTFDSLNNEAVGIINKIANNSYVSPSELDRLELILKYNSKRIASYQKLYNTYGEDSGLQDVSGLISDYHSIYESLPEAREYYGDFKDKDEFNGKMKDAKEIPKLYAMTAKELKGKTGVAYTTYDDYEIKWEDLYQDAYAREYEQSIRNKYNVEEDGKYVKKDLDWNYDYSEFNDPNDYKEVFYNFVNGDEDATSWYIANENILYPYLDSKEKTYFTPEEKAIFNTIWKNEGYDAAYKYANEIIAHELRARRLEEETTRAIEFAKENPFSSSLAAIVVSPYDNMMSAAGVAADYVVDGKINPNDSAYIPRKVLQTTEGTVEKNIDSGLGKWLYRNSMSIGKNLVNTALSGGNKALSVFLNGSGVAVDTVLDAKSRGVSDDDAITLGVISGVAEGFFESESIEALLGGKNVTESVWKYIVNNITTEVKGELLTQLTTDVSDYLIAQDLSNINLAFQAYKDSGMSASDALKSVVLDKVIEYGDVAASAAFSGGVMSGGSSVIGQISHSSYITNVGEYVNNNPTIANSIITTGVDLGVEEATNIIVDIEEGGLPSAKEMGRLTEKVISQSITKDGGMKNIMNWVSTLEGRDSSYMGSMEAVDTAKAVMHFAEGKATDVDNSLISQSDGATTLLTAIEHNPKAFNSIKDAAKVELINTTPSTDTSIETAIDDAHAIVKDGEVFDKKGNKLTVSEKSDIDNGVVVNNEAKRMKETDAEGYSVAERLGDSLKKPVKFVKELYDADGKMLDGMETDSGIFINTSAKNPIKWAVTHEFSHTMKKSAGKTWSKYQNFVVDYLKRNGTYYKLFDAKAKAYGTTDANYINEEIAADFIGETFSSVDELAKFIKKDRGLAETVRDIYYKVLDKLGLVDEKKKAQLMWRDAYRKAVLNVEKGKVESKGETRYRKVDKRKRTPYNEYYTNAMSWASATDRKPGDITIVNADYYSAALIEATEDGFVELAKGNHKEMKAKYEQIYRDAVNEIRGNLESYETDKGTGHWNLRVYENGGNGDGNTRSAKSEGFQNDTPRNNEHLRKSDKRKSITGSRISDVDSNGNTLTESQQKYFKDSKVRDKDGNLLVMYQGSANDFTIFDRKKSNYANMYGRGFYFTESENHASQYGKTRAYYLNIKHPISTTETTITKEQLRKFLQVVSKNEDYSFENYGYGATVDSVLQSMYGKSDFLMLNDVSQTAIGDLVEAIELFNKINGTDYDGIRLDTETVIFNSEQAKLITNAKPTSNPDIKKSISGTRLEDIEAENARLRKELENAHIQLNQAEGKGINVKEVKKLAQDLRKKYGSKIRLSELHQDLTKLYSLMASDKATADEVSERISNITDKVISKAVQTITFDEYSDLLSRIKDTKIMVPEAERADFKDGSESFRKGNIPLCP